MDENGHFDSIIELETLPFVEEFTDVKIEDQTDDIAVAWRVQGSGSIEAFRVPVEQARQLALVLARAVEELAEFRRTRGPRRTQ